MVFLFHCFSVNICPFSFLVRMSSFRRHNSMYFFSDHSLEIVGSIKFKSHSSSKKKINKTKQNKITRPFKESCKLCFIQKRKSQVALLGLLKMLQAQHWLARFMTINEINSNTREGKKKKTFLKEKSQVASSNISYFLPIET